VKELPQLDKKLDLVLRDRSIDEALAAIGQATGIKIDLLKGSVDDAASLLGETPRVTYLDLRRATVAQALDWILQPARISWSPVKKGITAGTDRRREGISAWVYDVSDIALPLADELEKLEDPQKAVAESQKLADEFLDAARKELKEPGQLIVWYAPGELLVLAHPKTHEKAAKLLESLRSPGAKQSGSLAAKTFKRVTARKEQLAKAREAREQYSVAAAHDQFGWQLLAAAAAGRLDDEALTELSVAWRDSATQELLKEDASLVLRSLWIVCEAARSMPRQRELAELAKAAIEQSQDARQQVLQKLQASPTDELARLGVLYSALAIPDAEAYRAEALPLFKTSDEESASIIPVVARVLLDKPTAADRQSLATLSAEQVAGADRVVLAALACRRASDETWQRFRAASAEILGAQQLPGEVIVLVNELSQPQLLLATQQ
jgi:hypothetical protein